MVFTGLLYNIYTRYDEIQGYIGYLSKPVQVSVLPFEIALRQADVEKLMNIYQLMFVISYQYAYFRYRNPSN